MSENLPEINLYGLANHGKIRLAVVTNIQTPYRDPVFERLSNSNNLDLLVFFCQEREPNREWDLPNLNFKKSFLSGFFVTFSGRYIHFNFDILPKLFKYRPDVVITSGFNPTHIIAQAYCRIFSKKHIAMTDGTLDSEMGLSWAHRFIRKIVFGYTAAFIGASNGSKDLYLSYGVGREKIFRSSLCVDNNKFAFRSGSDKQYDFIFSGRFVSVKNPLFALRVAVEVAKKIGRQVRVNFLGSGELLPQLKSFAKDNLGSIDVNFAGFLNQCDIRTAYSEARIFLFPTLWDPWGVVVNEAMASGLPVISSPNAGASHDLVIQGVNGFVLPLEIQQWVDASVLLLNDSFRYESYSRAAIDSVRKYNFDDAARGVIDAVYSSFK